MYKKNIYSLLPIISALFGFLSLGLSVAFLETGVYSSELFQYTESTGATRRYIFAICSFLVVYFLVFNIIVNKKWISTQKMTNNKQNDEPLYKIISLTGLGIAILYCNYIPQETVDSRNLYLIDNPAFLRDLISKYFPFVSLYLGVAAGFTKKIFTKITICLSLLLIFIALYSFGHKASAFISFLNVFLLSFFVIKAFTKNKHTFSEIFFNKTILVAFGILISFVFAGTRRYVHIANYDLTDYMKERILCFQGGIWWAIDYLKIYTKNEINMNNFIQFELATDYNRNLSLIYLMEKAIGEETTNKIVSLHHNIYTGGFPASFYIFGKEGPIFLSCLTGFISAITCGYFVRTIIKRQYILIAPYFYIYLYITSILESGEFVQLLTIKFASYLFVVLFAEYSLLKLYNKRVIVVQKACLQ